MFLSFKPKTSLYAAFFVSVMSLAACKQPGQIPELQAQACDSAQTPIDQIQGSGEVSPLSGQEVLTKGIVTHLATESGVYIEDSADDDSKNTSNGMFVSSAELSELIAVGDQVLVAGLIAELGEDSNTISSLTQISGFKVCSSHHELPVTRVSLPLTAAEREALEGMMIVIDQEVVITDAYNAASGLQMVNLGEIMPAPTEVARPGPDARARAATNRLTSVNIQRFDPSQDILPAGTRLLGLKGVLGHDGRDLRLLQSEPLRIVPSNPLPVPGPLDTDIRVVGFNLLNYFNGDGTGGGFPTPRGAETIDAFHQQRVRLSAAIEYAQPHLVAVMELENDGFGENSAALDFIADLESATDVAWNVVAHDGPVGGDIISVGLFYRADKLTPVGRAEILESPEFQSLSRSPMAQSFQDNMTGETFLVVVNHLKSKGSCPADGRNADLKDGQGCWNLARTQAAKAMTQWTRTLANRSSEGKALILGDMNAYRMEDPIKAIIDAGFGDLKASGGFASEFSYIRFGAAGTLDYAFASTELRPFVQTARILHINSSYPPGIDLPQPWLRSSDHDPVLVDLRFRHSATLD